MSDDFEQLYNTYYMQVYSFVMTLVKNQHDPEEITQKTFFKAMATKRRYRGESSEFTWLCAIAKNLFTDECRRHKSAHELTESASLDEDIETVLVDKESAFRVYQMLHELEEPYKEVFQLRVFGELPFQKIALLFGKTENWARVTYHRARLKIQERMDSL